MARLLALDEVGCTTLQCTIVFPIYDCPKYDQNYSPMGVVWSVVTVCRPRRSDIKCVGDGSANLQANANRLSRYGGLLRLR